MQTLSAPTVRAVAVAVLAGALAAGCRHDANAGAADTTTTASAATTTDSATAAAPAPNAPTASAADAQAPLAVDDIDRWKRGMDAELQAVKDAGAKLHEARTGTDSLNALAAMNETATHSAGARAAGVDEARYQQIRTTFSGIVGRMAPIEQGMDTSQMPATAVEALKKSREQGLAQATAGLAPAVVEALRTRAAELRKQDLALTGERLKAAGAGQ